MVPLNRKVKEHFNLEKHLDFEKNLDLYNRGIYVFLSISFERLKNPA
jgi:hypothetical protein